MIIEFIKIVKGRYYSFVDLNIKAILARISRPLSQYCPLKKSTQNNTILNLAINISVIFLQVISFFLFYRYRFYVELVCNFITVNDFG